MVFVLSLGRRLNRNFNQNTQARGLFTNRSGEDWGNEQVSTKTMKNETSISLCASITKSKPVRNWFQRNTALRRPWHVPTTSPPKPTLVIDMCGMCLRGFGRMFETCLGGLLRDALKQLLGCGGGAISAGVLEGFWRLEGRKSYRNSFKQYYVVCMCIPY